MQLQRHSINTSLGTFISNNIKLYILLISGLQIVLFVRFINKTIDFKMYYISKLKIFLFLRNILYFAYVNIIGNAKQIS